jgi:WD40 repeat protein
VAFSSDGSRVVTGSDDRSARVWDIATEHKHLALPDAPPHLSWAMFSANSSVLVAFDAFHRPSTAVHLWNIQLGTKLGSLELSNVINAGVSADGTHLVTITAPQSAKGKRQAAIWDIPTLRPLQTITADEFRISPEGTKMLSLERNHRSQNSLAPALQTDDFYTVRMWKIAGGTELASLNFSNTVLNLSRDGQHLCQFVGRSGLLEFQLIVPETGQVIGTSTNVRALTYAYVLPKAEQAIVFGDLALRSPAGDQPSLLLMDVRNGRDTPIFVERTLGNARVWPKTGHDQDPFLGPRTQLYNIAADGRHVPMSNGGITMWVLDTVDGRLVELDGHSGEVKSVALFSDGRRVLTGSEDRTAKIWDIETGRELLSLPHSAPVTVVAVAPDGKSLFTFADGGKAALWTRPGSSSRATELPNTNTLGKVKAREAEY